MTLPPRLLQNIWFRKDQQYLPLSKISQVFKDYLWEIY